MKIVYTASPLGAKTAEEIAANVQTAIDFGAWINKTYTDTKSIVPHKLATIMDDNNPEHRRMGLEIDLQILFPLADEIWVLGERISHGMQMEIDAANAKNLPIRYFIEADCGYMEVPKCLTCKWYYIHCKDNPEAKCDFLAGVCYPNEYSPNK